MCPKALGRESFSPRAAILLIPFSLMPDPLLRNESGNWNPSGLFGMVITLRRLDFIIQCQWWSCPCDQFFSIFILFGSGSCVIIYPESFDWDKVGGLCFQGLFLFLLFGFFFCLNYALWNLFGHTNIINIEACYDTSFTELHIVSWRRRLRKWVKWQNWCAHILLLIGELRKRGRMDVGSGWTSIWVAVKQNTRGFQELKPPDLIKFQAGIKGPVCEIE